MLLATDQLADKLEVVQGTILPGEEIGGLHGTNWTNAAHGRLDRSHEKETSDPSVGPNIS